MILEARVHEARLLKRNNVAAIRGREGSGGGARYCISLAVSIGGEADRKEAEREGLASRPNFVIPASDSMRVAYKTQSMQIPVAARN